MEIVVFVLQLLLLLFYRNNIVNIKVIFFLLNLCKYIYSFNMNFIELSLLMKKRVTLKQEKKKTSTN